MSRWIDEHGAIRVRKTGGIGHEKPLAPGLGSATLPGSFNPDIIGLALSGAMKPTNKKIPSGSLHDAGGVVVPDFQGKQQLRFVKWT